MFIKFWTGPSSKVWGQLCSGLNFNARYNDAKTELSEAYVRMVTVTVPSYYFPKVVHVHGSITGTSEKTTGTAASTRTRNYLLNWWFIFSLDNWFARTVTDCAQIIATVTQFWFRLRSLRLLIACSYKSACCELSVLSLVSDNSKEN
jgi:hypothetical protein